MHGLIYSNVHGIYSNMQGLQETLVQKGLSEIDQHLVSVVLGISVHTGVSELKG